MIFKISKIGLFIFCLLSSTLVLAQMQKLKVSDNNRFLVKEDGSPFIWMGETNWFFAKLPPETINKILDKRKSQGFNVVLVSCRENLYNGDDPGSINHPNENWWKYLDEYIEKCRQRELYVGITLGWWGKIHRHSETELFEFGRWVGNRYQHQNNIIWLTLGEAGAHQRKRELPKAKLTALIRGIRAGDTGNKLLTVHADYKRGTSLGWEAELCDFNNWQTSQWKAPHDLPKKEDKNWTAWEAIEFDYNQKYDGKPKPIIDMEAWYENNKDFCDASDFEIRRRACFTILAGAFGHNYGAGGIWDGLNEKQGCSGSALDALEYTGAKQIGCLSNFLQKLGDDFLKLQPKQNLIEGANPKNYDEHLQAALAEDDSYALVYSASDKEFKLNLKAYAGKRIKYHWFNPRENTYSEIQEIKIKKSKTIVAFNPPGNIGAGNDWVLLILPLNSKTKTLKIN